MLHRLSLCDMAARIQAREVSPAELVEAHLEQIDRVNPRINAFVLILAEQARQRAAEIERALGRGEDPGPLAGVPVTVKDSFDVEGLPTLCGSRLRLGHRAARHAFAVARLEAAGAILLGKTNTPELLMNYETDNHITGRTNNPWNPDYTPGGSSGGEAAAIAAYCSAGGLGSDGGGSIRLPAHFCGIAGLKPTPGRVPATGHFPVIGHPGGLLGVAGPMARNARDLRLLFEVVAGYDPADPFSAPVPLGEASLEGVRIGFTEQFYQVPVEPAAARAVRGAAEALHSLGFAVEPFMPRGLERAPNVWSFLFSELPAPVIREMFAGREAEVHWTGLELIDQFESRPEPTAREVLEHLAIRDRMRAAVLDEMDRYPVLLWPPAGVVAFRHRRRRWETPGKAIGYFEAMMPLTPANLLGLPAVVIPWMLTPDGLPVGVQLIGRPYEELRLLELAVRLEEVRGPFPGPPGF